MSNLNLKGIWIPIEILTDNKLSDKEKSIYSIIIYLSKEKQYCFLTNKTTFYFRCNTYATNTHLGLCTPHSYNLEKVTNFVIEQIYIQNR